MLGDPGSDTEKSVLEICWISNQLITHYFQYVFSLYHMQPNLDSIDYVIIT